MFSELDAGRREKVLSLCDYGHQIRSPPPIRWTAGETPDVLGWRRRRCPCGEGEAGDKGFGSGRHFGQVPFRYGLYPKARRYKVFSMWPKIVGDIARYAVPRRLSGDVLFVAPRRLLVQSFIS